MTTKIRLLHDTVGIPTGAVAVTQGASDNTTKVATTAYVTTALANLADSAPSTLNTLNELAAALGDDANFSTTVTNSIAAKAPLASPTLTGSLNVVPTAATGLTYAADGTNTYINFKANSVGDSVQLYAGQSSGGFFSIGTKNSSGTLAERMRINASGNVGIGTNSFTSNSVIKELVVKSTVTNGVSSYTLTTTDNALGGGMRLTSFNDTNALVFGMQTSYNETDTSPPTERMRINSSGYVGIGTTSPSSQFVVAASNGGKGIETQVTTHASNNQFILAYDRANSAYLNMEISALNFGIATNNGTNRFNIRSDGGVAIGLNNAGYSSQILSVKSGAADNVLYGESTDANCFAVFRDNSSNTNVAFGAIGNDHVFRNDSTEKWRMQASTGYLIGQSASQVRLVLGSTGNSSNNTSNWIRGTGNVLGLNSAGGNIGFEIGGNAKMTVNTTGQILANSLGVTTPTFAFINDTNTGMTRPTGDTLQFVTGGTERMRIDSTGRVFIGKSSTGLGTSGVEINQGGYIQVTESQSPSLYLNRLSTDGSIINFYKDGTQTGGVSTWGGNIAFGRLNCALKFNDDNNRIYPASVDSNMTRDNAVDLGDPSHRFNDIWIGGGIHLGGTGTVNKLDDYEFGGWTPALVTSGGVTTSSISYYSMYTKIGRICHIHAKITATLSSLPGQTVAISGLPFPAKDSSDSQQRAIIAIGGDTQNTGGNTPKAHFRTNGSQLQGVYWNASNNTAYWAYNAWDSTSFEIHVHGHYTTT